MNVCPDDVSKSDEANIVYSLKMAVLLSNVVDTILASHLEYWLWYFYPEISLTSLSRL